jgi:hypothetical protein
MPYSLTRLLAGWGLLPTKGRTMGTVPHDHRDEADLTEDPATGMQHDYIVLSDKERAKGYVRPLRYSYLHLACGTTTSMSHPLAETYARDPHFYGATYCVGCRTHLPVGEDGQFVWLGTDIKVGT